MAEERHTSTFDLHQGGSDSEMSTQSADGAAGMASDNPVPHISKEMDGDIQISTIDRLLERNRSEIMFELRRMQHGDRPVTGQGNKEALETLFQQQIDSADPSAPVNEEHRNETVVVEVQGLVQSRPVSSLLGTTFRRRLENALRSSFQTVNSRHQSTPPTRSSHVTPSQSNRVQVPAPPPLPGTQNGRSTVHVSTHPAAQAVEAMLQRRAAQPAPAAAAAPPAAAPSIPAAPPLPAPEAEEPRQARAAAWLNNHVDAELPEDPRERQYLAVHDHLQEDLIEEISELVQRQLVTQTLEGDFRSTLETRIANHLSNTRTDGPRVQQFIQSLPRSDAHVRNNFSHLGINSAQQGAMAGSDEVSVISATAAVHVSQNHVSRAVSLELSSLRSQVNELKEMMKMSFDLQLDIQRAIRQEVAAAVSAALVDTPTIQSQQPRSRPVNDTNCLICLDKATDTVLYQCGHMCVCYTCGMSLKQRGQNCPMCRAPIRDIIRAYRCSAEEN